MRDEGAGLKAYGVDSIQIEFVDCYNQIGFAVNCSDGIRKAYRCELPLEMLSFLNARWKERHQRE